MLTATEKIRVPRFVNLEQSGGGMDAAAEIRQGLSQHQAVISPKYFYDALGSRLFDAITELDEYYPTRTEAGILRMQAEEIAQAVGTGHTLVDLGAGNCEKAGRLFATLKPSRYIAVDISADYLHHALTCLQRVHPDVDMLGVGMDFSRSLKLPAELGDEPRVVFYPGSSIGNFTPDEALAFLKQTYTLTRGGSLMIGVDMVKDKAVLEAAYDDALGVTAAFNLNALPHVNRIAGTDFMLRDWQHVALFNESQSRIEMHLEAKRDVKLSWPGGARNFKQGERIHSENSYKYRAADFEMLLSMAGFTQVQRFTDDRGWFSVFIAQA